MTELFQAWIILAVIGALAACLLGYLVGRNKDRRAENEFADGAEIDEDALWSAVEGDLRQSVQDINHAARR